MAKEFRRKAPRRDYHGSIGLLHKWSFIQSPCLQVGEGGALVAYDALNESVQIGDQFVFTIFLPNIGGVTSLAQCLYKNEAGDFGVSFFEIDMKFKKRVREYVSRRKQ